MRKRVEINEAELNKIELKEFKDIEIGKMLYFCREAELSSNYCVKAICRILYKSLFNSNIFSQSGFGNTLFLFSNSYAGRLDLLRTFDKVVSLTENHVRMVGSRTRSLHVSFLKNLARIFLWNHELKKVVKSQADRWYFIEILYGAFIDYLEFEKYEKQNHLEIKSLVSLCDVHAVDYYFTEKFRQQGKKTVTLQHGIFSSTADAWAFSESRSDYFILNSQYSKDEAILSGHPEKGLIVAGLPSYIFEEDLGEKENFENRRVGLVLEGEYCHKDNEIMISFMQEYCKAHDKELIIKLHPVSNIGMYENVIDFSLVKNVYGKEISILEFASKIDVAIIRNTTSILELINHNVPCFIFVSDNPVLDVYQNLVDLRFSTNERLTELLTRVIEEGYSEEFNRIRQYLGGGTNVADNYRCALKEIGIE